MEVRRGTLSKDERRQVAADSADLASAGDGGHGGREREVGGGSSGCARPFRSGQAQQSTPCSRQISKHSLQEWLSAVMVARGPAAAVPTCVDWSAGRSH